MWNAQSSSGKKKEITLGKEWRIPKEFPRDVASEIHGSLSVGRLYPCKTDIRIKNAQDLLSDPC
jgi:hypothetical protein